MHGLKGLRVIDHSSAVAGPYCSKLFADAGADVIKLETSEGDPLRRWSASGATPDDRDGGLFRYLNASKRSVVGSLPGVGGARDVDEVEALLRDADLLIVDASSGAWDRGGLHNEEILRELGLGSDEVESLAREGVIGRWPEGV